MTFVIDTYLSRWAATYDNAHITGKDGFTIVKLNLDDEDHAAAFFNQLGNVSTDAFLTLRTYLDKTFVDTYGVAKLWGWLQPTFMIAVHNPKDLFNLRLTISAPLKLVTAWEADTKFFMRVAKGHNFKPCMRKRNIFDEEKRKRIEDPHGML